MSLLRVTRVLLIGLVPVLGLAMAHGGTIIESQSFDDAASAAAAGWTGHLNTPADGQGMDAGYRDSSLAGGTTGEAGGTMPSRSAEFAWYADTTIDGSLTGAEALIASGHFTVESIPSFDGAFELGWFDRNGDRRPAAPGIGGIEDAIAIRVYDNYGTSDYRMGLRFSDAAESGWFGQPYLITGLLPATDYLFRMTWDPQGSGENLGTLALHVARADDPSQYEDHALTNVSWSAMDLNSFGLVTNDFDTVLNGPTVYIDDLRYGIWKMVTGDANYDGIVNALDAGILASNWLTPSGATWEMGDFNGDGAVDDTDATLLAINWEGGASSASRVPEPSGIWMILGAILTFAALRCRR